MTFEQMYNHEIDYNQISDFIKDQDINGKGDAADNNEGSWDSIV